MQFRSRRFVLFFAFVAALAGCEDPREPFGKTWYIDGAGNWGFGVAECINGMDAAGYRGRVDNFRWSVTAMPALDQILRFVAQDGGKRLGGVVSNYMDKYPDTETNIIALSAGTGVGMWAIESVRPPHKVNNYVMLGSSISSKYDATKALKNMKGRIVVYYSSTDAVLNGPVRTLGTIDGTFDDAAGLVGLHGRGYASGRVFNIAWAPKFERLGWVGGHTDSTSYDMMRLEISKYIVPAEDRLAARQGHARKNDARAAPPRRPATSKRPTATRPDERSND